MVMSLDHANMARQTEARAATRKVDSPGLRWTLLAQVGPDPLLDLLAEIGVDVAPVLEHPRQHRLLNTLRYVANDVVGQAFPGGVVENLADHGAGLPPVVVLGVQRVRRADH